MLRFLQGRWIWGAIAVGLTAWWMQRSRRQGVRHAWRGQRRLRVNGVQSSIGAVARAGQSVVDQAARALGRR
ncbi:MAG TPA: hypothetical protein VK101_10350 [Limnochordia bacterium]|nr:hypothetical protein [Limnochordia bacterium]